MRKSFFIFLSILLIVFYGKVKGENLRNFPLEAPYEMADKSLRLRTNILPWAIAVPNIGAEYVIAEKWSLTFDILYCPWKISDHFAIKNISILPEGRWWLKTSQKGSFFNIHADIAWFNARLNDFRYQDQSRPLLGAGIGYGYRLEINPKWGVEFEIGAGVANMKYDVFYNIPDGALKDTRVTTYWGIDRLGVTFTYHLCDL